MSKQLTKIASIIDEISMGPFGSDIKVDNFINEGVPVLNGSNLTRFKLIEDGFKYVSPEKAKTFKKAIAKRGDIVITHRGTLGQISYIPDNSKFDEYVISQSQFRVALNRKMVDPAYFVYFFHTSEGQKRLLANKCHVGVPALAQATTNFKLIEIPLPSLTIQKQISAVLSSLESKIELNNRINAELEAMAKTVYDYWFVQFDFPFDFAQGKPSAEGKPYKSSGGKMVWSEELKREVPEGWEVSLFADWIFKDKNGDWGKESLEGNYTEHVSCIRGADINGLNGKGECNPPERYILEKNNNKQLNSHDLIVEISGGSPTQSTGRLAYLIDETLSRFENPLICSNFCKAIELKNKKQLFNFVHNWNRLYDNGVLFGYEGKTSGIKNLLFDSFVNSYWVALPPQELVNKFYDLMLDIEKKKQTALKENQQLSSLRDWLLPMLMNGQVKVGSGYEGAVVSLMAAEPGEKYGE
jgi:type I restriction enzyme S subunit